MGTGVWVLEVALRCWQGQTSLTRTPCAQPIMGGNMQVSMCRSWGECFWVLAGAKLCRPWGPRINVTIGALLASPPMDSLSVNSSVEGKCDMTAFDTSLEEKWLLEYEKGWIWMILLSTVLSFRCWLDFEVEMWRTLKRWIWSSGNRAKLKILFGGCTFYL